MGINLSLQVGHEKNFKKAEELNKKENAQKKQKRKRKERKYRYVSAQENIGNVLSLPTIYNTPGYEAANTKQKQ